MTGTQLKLRGMRLAASKHKEALNYAQSTARLLAGDRHSITAEDVREAIVGKGRDWNLGNAAGSVFAGDEWECCGVTTAKRPEAHGRVIRQWRLKR